MKTAKNSIQMIIIYIVWTPSENHVIWVDVDLNPLLTKFPGSAHGGIHLARTLCVKL